MARWTGCALLLLFYWGLPACAPSLRSSDWDTRAKAVRRLGAEDQALLTRIATQDESETVRAAAAEKLTDQSLLTDLAVKDGSMYVRVEAARRITDQDMLGKVVLQGIDGGVRSKALDKITDQGVLAKMALAEHCGHDSDVYRRAVVEKLTDQAVLAQMAFGDWDEWTRAAAAERLTDQALLEKIALADDKEASIFIRTHAVPRLTDQAVLAKVALGDDSYHVRLRAVEHLEDQAVLAEISEEDGNDEVRELAAGRLTAEGMRRCEQLQFEQIRDSEDRCRLRAFISRYPDGPYTNKARSQLRTVLHPWAVAEGTCGAYAEFLADFPQDPAAGELRRKLAAKGQWEKAKRLGELAIAMMPISGIDEKGRLVNTNPTPLKPALEQFRVLLAAGADASVVRIKDFTPAVTVQDGQWEAQHTGVGMWSVGSNGMISQDAFQQTSRPPRTEHPVPAAEGGLTLSEYSRANQGTWAEAVWCENNDPDFPVLAQEAVGLLEQPDANSNVRDAQAPTRQ